jgi:hypothetical protein
MLVEVVNQGAAVFARCRGSAKGEVNEDVAPLYLYLHIVEMLDGVQVLVSQSCPLPAASILRSAFEAMISLLYILAADSKRRALAWLYQYARNRSNTYDQLDASSQRGAPLRAAIEKEEVGISLPPAEDVLRVAAPVREFLERPDLAEVKAEFAACKERRGGREPRWYELFDGPRSLEQLAAKVDKGTIYQILYRHWSGVAHAHDISRFITSTPSGEPAIRPLRDPLDVPQVASLGASLFLDASRSLIAHYRPGEDFFTKWYLEEIAAAYISLSNAHRARDHPVGEDAGT